MFALANWVQLMLGQGLYPRDHHPAADLVADADLHALVDHVDKVVASKVALVPAHERFIASCCAAPARIAAEVRAA